ncbi:Uncharacterised protein [Halioglobus japonicus]|nr:Uncharacterised protein [Halioglobus japonicus]
MTGVENLTRRVTTCSLTLDTIYHRVIDGSL